MGGVDENIARLCEEEDLFHSSRHDSHAAAAHTPTNRGRSDPESAGGAAAAEGSPGQTRRMNRNSYRVRQYALASEPFVSLLRSIDDQWFTCGSGANATRNGVGNGDTLNPMRKVSAHSLQSTITSVSSTTENAHAATDAAPPYGFGFGAADEPRERASSVSSSVAEDTATGSTNKAGGGKARGRAAAGGGERGASLNHLSRTTFRQLFLLALRHLGMLCVGLFRKIDLCDRNARSKRYASLALTSYCILYTQCAMSCEIIGAICLRQMVDPQMRIKIQNRLEDVLYLTAQRPKLWNLFAMIRVTSPEFMIPTTASTNFSGGNVIGRELCVRGAVGKF